MAFEDTMQEQPLLAGCSEDNFSRSYESNIQQKYDHDLRNEVKFFFLNPIEKWNARKKFPYKFLVQIIKIFVITLQLFIFADGRYSHGNYVWNNKMAFSHLFLKGWDSAREVTAYPPSFGPLALYRVSEFYQTVEYAVFNYRNLTNAIGPYSYVDGEREMKLCVFDHSGSHDETNCVYISSEENDQFSAERFIHNNTKLRHISEATLEFSIISTVHTNQKECRKFNIVILMDNTHDDGQMVLSLETNAIRYDCYDNNALTEEWIVDSALQTVVNVAVFVTCMVSLMLCCRAIYRAHLLKRKVVNYLWSTRKIKLSLESKMEFWNFWYIVIIVDDILIIFGTYLQQHIGNFGSGEMWNTCSVLLGTGNLLVWFGVLRYLGFFKTYNVVILTVKRAFPKLIRFLVCALLIYAGFVFCGWLILGPYHMKFTSISSTSECLFSLINGDDMFATFTTMNSKSSILWWYSRIYIYTFVTVFIYVILSLFISVIMDSYETIKEYYKVGFPKSQLQVFMDEENED